MLCSWSAAALVSVWNDPALTTTLFCQHDTCTIICFYGNITAPITLVEVGELERAPTLIKGKSAHMYACMYVCMYMYVVSCMYMYIVSALWLYKFYNILSLIVNHQLQMYSQHHHHQHGGDNQSIQVHGVYNCTLVII